MREIEHFHHLFSHITWIGFDYNHPGYAKNLRKAEVNNLTYILLPFSGGNSVLKKLKALFYIPWYALVLFREIGKHRYIHSRAPSMPSFLAVIMASAFRNKKYWHKYAGNWGDPHPSFFYGVQRWFMKRSPREVITVNGQWPGQQPNILSFENPCISETERQDAIQITKAKRYDGKLTLLFVGRMEREKGVYLILDALNKMSAGEKARLGCMQFVGNGADLEVIKQQAETTGVPCVFHGSMGRDALNRLYAESHYLLLPSMASEGFPKVLAEASAFGCLPVVSAISSITQYIKTGKNGFVLDACSADALCATLVKIQSLETVDELVHEAREMVRLFTYERYNQRISNEIFGLTQAAN